MQGEYAIAEEPDARAGRRGHRRRAAMPLLVPLAAAAAPQYYR